MKDHNAARLVMLALVALLGAPLAAQSPPAPPANAERDEQTVRAWVQRWNALGGDNAKAIDELLALYAPDALHITGPLPHQRGTATYRGHDGIRVLASRIAASQQGMTYRIETETANEETAELLHVAAGPWKGPAIAIQIVAAYTDRDPSTALRAGPSTALRAGPSTALGTSGPSTTLRTGGKRWVVPGAAFFQLVDGKIRRVRIYFADAEKAEVEPQPKRRPPGD
ncbi:MAG: nuclear transport factor 2 family protein [Acidobacteriota bacterium]|nr:nuclear transport factor 2 family protein [Acidobacteriota bacterium]